jgi:hypothetical protein
MRSVTRRLAAKHVAVVVALALASACAGDGGADPTSTTRKHATSTSTAAVDPSVIPDDPRDITAAYVDAVLAELMKVDGDALRLTVRAGAVPSEAVALLDSAYSTELAARRANDLSALVRDPESGLRKPPGDLRVTVDEVITATKSCVFVRATQNFSRVFVDPGENFKNYYALSAHKTARSPWVISLDGFNANDSRPDDPCVD